MPDYLIENDTRAEAYKIGVGDVIISSRGATKLCIIPEHDGGLLISQNRNSGSDD